MVTFYISLLLLLLLQGLRGDLVGCWGFWKVVDRPGFKLVLSAIHGCHQSGGGGYRNNEP